jgi:hypothetical protein
MVSADKSWWALVQEDPWHNYQQPGQDTIVVSLLALFAFIDIGFASLSEFLLFKVFCV